MTSFGTRGPPVSNVSTLSAQRSCSYCPHERCYNKDHDDDDHRMNKATGRPAPEVASPPQLVAMRLPVKDYHLAMVTALTGRGESKSTDAYVLHNWHSTFSGFGLVGGVFQGGN